LVLIWRGHDLLTWRISKLYWFLDDAKQFVDIL